MADWIEQIRQAQAKVSEATSTIQELHRRAQIAELELENERRAHSHTRSELEDLRATFSAALEHMKQLEAKLAEKGGGG